MTLDLRTEIIELLSELIKIDSANTWLTGGIGEKNVLGYIANWLGDLGIETAEEAINDEHSNLVATIHGTGGKGLTLYAHADTVGYELWPGEALKPRVDGDKLYGLGSADDKGHVAAIMLAAKLLKESGVQLSGDLHLAFVADEEGETIGSFDYVKKHKPEACLILESAPPGEINTTHQGFGWLKIKTFGRSGHGSASSSSVDAIAAMAEVIVRLERNARENFAKNPDPLNQQTVYHTSYIMGGTDFASYPESCELGIEIGTQVGETIQDRMDEIEKIFAEVRELNPSFRAEVRAVLSRGPFQTSGSDELYEILSKSIRELTGVTPKATGDNAWGDAQIFQDAGFPTLSVGALGGELHAPNEWVSISGLEGLIKIIAATVREYLE